MIHFTPSGQTTFPLFFIFFFFNDTATTEIYTLSLHDALPISGHVPVESTAHRRARRGRHEPGHAREAHRHCCGRRRWRGRCARTARRGRALRVAYRRDQARPAPHPAYLGLVAELARHDLASGPSERGASAPSNGDARRLDGRS